MSQSHGPYKSQLFSTLNRQSQRLRDRLGTTVRQIKVAAEWGVQALIYPFYWLLHPQKWLGPMLGASSTSSPPALPSFPQEKDQDYADLSFTSDHPIQSVLATVQPWLLEPDPAPAVALTDNLNDYLRESLGSQAIDQKGSAIAIAQKPALPAGAVTFALPPTTSPSLLSHWGHQLKTLFHRPDSTIVIQGIACRCSDRRLVLTTQDNLSLDILSLAQQQTLNTLIRQELAQFCYQSRRQWALTQQQWRGIPLINGKSQQVIAPLDWLWQGIYRWQTRPESPGQLIAVAAPSLPPLPPIQDWVGQTTTALAHHPVIEATVVKSQRVSAQIIDAIPLSACLLYTSPSPRD